MKLIHLVASVGFSVALVIPAANAVTILGDGASPADFLIGGDLTDPEDDGLADADTNYNATFRSSEEPAFGGGEFAFNVFDNLVGVGNAKWCCGGGSPGIFPIWVDATFSQPVNLTSFTITSGNDTPGRDPVDWQIQGSNDGTNFTNIFTHSGSNMWTARNQTILWDGTDFAAAPAYSTLRLNVDTTGLTSGALFQLNEVEFFGTVVPEPSSSAFFGLAGLAFVLRRRR